MRNDNSNDVVTAGVAALAVASKTPFKTAFKVTMGIALAQIATLAIIVASGALVLGVAVLVYSLVK